IIEDCASSIGAKINNQPVGTFGDLAIFSFGATKFITTGGGGMIVSRKDKYIERIRDYINYDYRKIYYPRFNFDFNDIQASIGIAQLEKLNDFIDRRKYIANKYIEICNKKGWNFQKPLKNEFLQNWYRFVLFLPEKDVVRLHNHLKKRGVSTIIPLERWELLNSYLGLDPKYFSNSVKASKHTLSVPIYPSLTEANLEDIIDALTKF
ncbi:MAG: hypothetical protein GYA14_05205, partial [Ignavibacteria bacterium]|nr:hypothetical protein [Ignavibacteria bacterium]